MIYFKFAKLVRDKIVKSMEQNGQQPRGVRILSDSEYVKELINKVIEEANEMRNTNSNEELKNELADVVEVIDYIKKVIKITDAEVIKLQQEKIDKSGGFNKRIFIDDVGVPENNKWFSYYVSNPEKYPEVK